MIVFFNVCSKGTRTNTSTHLLRYPMNKGFRDRSSCSDTEGGHQEHSALAGFALRFRFAGLQDPQGIRTQVKSAICWPGVLSIGLWIFLMI